MRSVLLGCAAVVLCVFGCAPNVDVTKTSKGFVSPTNPNNVEILHTKPDRKFTELGSLSTSGWAPRDTAKMHNALRAKGAPLGADAVIILQTGMTPIGYGQMQMWATGVAIKYTGS
jgi:hypothetical protein